MELYNSSEKVLQYAVMCLQSQNLAFQRVYFATGLSIREGYTILVVRENLLVRNSFQFMAFLPPFISKQIFLELFVWREKRKYYIQAFYFERSW